MAVSLPPLALDDHGENNNDPFQNGLVLRLDIPQPEDVVENAEGQGADHGANHRADAAGKAGAPDHHRHRPCGVALNSGSTLSSSREKTTEGC